MKNGQKLNLPLLLSAVGLLFISPLTAQQASSEVSRQQFMQQVQPYLNSIALIYDHPKSGEVYEPGKTFKALNTWFQQADFSKDIPSAWLQCWKSGRFSFWDLLEHHVFYRGELNPVLGFVSTDRQALLVVLSKSDTAVFLLKKYYKETDIKPSGLTLYQLTKDQNKEPDKDILFTYQNSKEQQTPPIITGKYLVNTPRDKGVVAALIEEHSLNLLDQDWQIVYQGHIAPQKKFTYRILAKNQQGDMGYFWVKRVASPGFYWQLIHLNSPREDYDMVGRKKIKGWYKYQLMANKMLYTLVIVLGIGSTLAFAIYFFIQRRRKYQQAWAQMALSGLRAQLNPHFLFNALTSIQDLMNQDKKTDANRYFNEMAQLLRYVVDSSAEEHTSLVSELAALEKYCSLEALRTPFTYEFNLHPDLDLQNIEIPTMLLQPFVENAILHGLRPSSESRHLKISLWPESMDRLGVAIIDDGIGIEESNSRQLSIPSQRGHQGLNTTTQRIHFLNQGKRQKIRLAIEDRSHLTPQQTGTQVQLSIPV